MQRIITLPILVFAGMLSGHAQSYDASLHAYMGIPFPCAGEVTPVVRIKNTGTVTMTGCVVDTWKNGVLVNSFDWQLSVPAVQNAIRMPALPTIEVEEGDVLEFRIISVNGMPDEGPIGNSIQAIMDGPPLMVPSPTVRVEVLTDANPGETTWAFHDADHQVVVGGGPYSEAHTVYETWVTLDPATCYLFMMHDSGGDGFYGSGYVRFFSLGEELFDVGTAVPFEVANAGLLTGTSVAVPEQRAGIGAVVFPSPGAGLVTIQLEGAEGMVHMDVFDVSGRVVLAGKRLPADGPSSVDLSSLENGRYHVRFRDDKGRIAVQHVVIAH